MKYSHTLILIHIGFLFLYAGTSAAQDTPEASITPPIATFAGEPTPYRSVTHHTLKIDKANIQYDAVAGETYLRDTAGNATGSIFSFSYIRTHTDEKNRPVLFVFNGGPGSASLWLHMGVVGPKKIVLDQDVNPSNVPPFELRANRDSLIDVADLVFIDPIGTGFSRPLNGTDPKIFWGIDEDADSIAQFIELWLSEHGRWNSPKYVMGESYGSVRAAVLPRALIGSPFYPGVMRGLTLDGIILLGTTLDVGPNSDKAEPTPEAVAAQLSRSLPSIAASAAYHGLIPGGDNIESVFDKAMSFSKNEYFEVLSKLQKNELTDADKASMFARLKDFTGVSADIIGDDLHISEREFAKSALASKGLELGIYDSRYTLPLENSGHDPVADDPAMTQYVPGFVSSFHQMLHDDLNVSIDRPYISIRWKDLLSNWNFERSFAPVKPKTPAEDLAWSLRRNTHLRVLVASGYFDLATPPAEAFADLHAGGVPMDRVQFKEYESGHMLYIGETASQFSKDVHDFIRGN